MKIHRDETLEALRVEVMKTLDAHGEEAAKGHTGLENLSKQLLALAEEGKRMSQEQEILKSLVFEEMEQREEAIKDAYKATLNWLFEKTEKNETKFMNWLEAGNGIYWVKGKVRVINCRHWCATFFVYLGTTKEPC
jgi:transposase